MKLMSDKLKTVIALGYFDSVHIGHQRVLNTARRYALERGARLVVFSFGGNLKAVISGNDDKSVYLPSERLLIINDLGADEVFFAPVSKDFLGLECKEFLALINEKYKIVCYVSGEDYRFGRQGLGDTNYLKAYAKENCQEYIVVPTENFEGEKISTTRIKWLLSMGEIKKANKMLGRAYSLTGKVFEDRKVGSKLGFPTVNIRLDKEKFKIKDGVYKGRVVLNNTEYSAIINYGARPTFDLSEKLIEAHIIDFNGNLYGKEIKLNFDVFMREIKKFSSQQELKAQLEKDLQNVREGKYD